MTIVSADQEFVDLEPVGSEENQRRKLRKPLREVIGASSQASEQREAIETGDRLVPQPPMMWALAGTCCDYLWAIDLLVKR